MPDPDTEVKLESTPALFVVTFINTKSEEDSLRVKVMVAVSPDFNAVVGEVIVIVGATVSTVIDSGVAARLSLPAASVKTPAATLKVAVVMLPAVGVKTAV